MEHADRVGAHDLDDGLVVETFHDVHRDLQRVRPRRVAVRVVRLERDVVEANALQILQPVRVVEEAAVDALVVVLRRRALDLLPDPAPRRVVLPDRVGALEGCSRRSDRESQQVVEAGGLVGGLAGHAVDRSHLGQAPDR